MKTKTVKFQIGRGKNGQWYWRIKATNGEIIAQGEGYKRRGSALKVFQILQSAFDHNEVVVQDVDCKGKLIGETLYIGTLVTPRDKK